MYFTNKSIVANRAARPTCQPKGICPVFASGDLHIPNLILQIPVGVAPLGYYWMAEALIVKIEYYPLSKWCKNGNLSNFNSS